MAEPHPALILRYGQKLRLCAVSAYLKDSPASALAAAASASSSSPATADSGPRFLSTTTWPVGIGYYEKNGRHGILSAVPPLGPALDTLFNEDEFTVLDPANLRALGDCVEYGHTVVLVNQHGMVWNNKTGGITGYVGPRARNTPGEMYVSFRRAGSGSAAASASAPSSASSTGLVADRKASVVASRSSGAAALAASTDGLSGGGLPTAASSSTLSSSSATNLLEPEGPVRYGDENVVIAVVESNRHSQMFNKRLTNFKKPTSKIVGGYICCDGKGTELKFTICPIKPRVEQISMLNKLITAYNYGQRIALPMGLLEKQHDRKTGLQQAEIFFKLSNQTSATLPGPMLQEKILAHAAGNATDPDKETEFLLPLRNGPGELVLKLVGAVPRRVLAKLTTGPKGQALGQATGVLAAPGHALHPRLTALQTLGGILRKVPVPAFALLYAVLTHFLWRGLADPNKGGLMQKLTVLALVLVPIVYVAAKVEHPLSFLFHPPALITEAEDDLPPSDTVKMIITEYRFPLQAAATLPVGVVQTVVVTEKRRLSGSGSNVVEEKTTVTVKMETLTPAAPGESVVPQRFILAEKGDEVKARERYAKTMAWRAQEDLDAILTKPWPHFKTIKNNYPHFYHKRGKNDEPVYYEKPGKINLKGLKGADLTLKDLMHNYLMVTEFLWQVLEPDDNKKCISVLDVEGIGISDFVGEAVDYVRNAAAVSGNHYPERCAYIFVINVPSWFSMIWNTVKTMMDAVTREKVIIVRGNKQKILEALADKIPLENIPEEYGGQSPGRSEEETLLFDLMAYLNKDVGAPMTNPIEAYRRRHFH